MSSLPDAVAPEIIRHREVQPLDIQGELKMYKPPVPKRGSRVEFFRNAQRNGRGLLGFVQAANDATADLWVPGNQYQALSAVRHMSDPHLKMEAHRINGAWDFSQEYYDEQERLNKIETAIKSLESIVTQLAAAANTAKAKESKEQERRDKTEAAISAIEAKLKAVDKFIGELKEPAPKSAK